MKKNPSSQAPRKAPRKSRSPHKPHKPRQQRPPLSPRRAAGLALADIERGKRLDQAIGRLDELGLADRALARAMLMLALRRHGDIAALLAAHIKRPLPKQAYLARALLHLGVVQLYAMDTPDHAAVSETVKACGRAQAAYRGLINAVLRKLAQTEKAARRLPDDPAANMPPFLMRQWVATYGADMAAQIARQHGQVPPLDLCFKTPALAQDFCAAHENLSPTLMGRNHVRLFDAPPVTALPDFEKGDWWVQDIAASYAAQMLDAVLPSGRACHILDMCAAPGGKTMQLAAAGHCVTALDVSAKRLDILRENLQRTNLTAQVVMGDALRWQKPAAAPPFDAVLLDAPCAASGTIRRHPDLLLHHHGQNGEKLAAMQAKLLDRAANMLGAGGVLAYAVCSLDPAEGAAQIEAFCRRQPDFALQSVPSEADVAGALTQNLGATAHTILQTTPAHWGEKGGMDGFFSAIMIKQPPIDKPIDEPKAQ